MPDFFEGWRTIVGVVALALIGGIFMQSLAIAVALLSCVSFVLSPLIAVKKRYAPYFWLFACGPVGLVAIACLPPLKVAKDPAEYERLENRANFIGTVLSCIGIFIAMIPAVAVFSYGLLQSSAVGVSR